MFKHQKSLFISLSVCFLFSSCKKDAKELIADAAPAATPFVPATPAATVTMAQLNQTAFIKTQDWYLWNTQLPGTYDAAAFADPVAVMSDIRRFSTEQGFSAPVDRWSFAMKKTEWNQISGGMSSLAGAAAGTGNFGITVFFRTEGDLRVRMSEPNSPAGAAGIRRGWRILSVNGNSNMVTSNANFIIANVYNSTSSSFTFQRPDGSTVNLSLNAGHYNLKPLYLDTVYQTSAGKVGYMVYNSFLGDINQSAAEYARVFNNFSAEGINELVVDLRYNGGGYVNLQEQLANYIINNASNGAVMMKQIYNTTHSGENSISYFQKSGSVSLNRIYFIVSSSTASASELLINNLKPYMDVRLVGNSKTHGKPVGYFPLENGEWYVFPVSFRTVNKNGEGNYYNGFTPNALVADGLDKDWGDVTESGLASALTNITSGAYRAGSEPNYYESPQVSAGNAVLDKNNLKLMIDQKN